MVVVRVGVAFSVAVIIKKEIVVSFILIVLSIVLALVALIVVKCLED
jgi:hypothetical protein